MAETQEYALLSQYVYEVRNKPVNRPNLPAGWTLLEVKPDNPLGFSYGVFKNSGTGEIVLAYTGTNENIDWLSNFLAGTGLLPAPQVSEAALVYQQVKEKYGGNITLSGHSLGGGLASVMAVWFNRPAVVFDEGPFQNTAQSDVIRLQVQGDLSLKGYSDPAMDNSSSYFTAREAQVANHYLQGEILNALRFDANTVAGTNTQIGINGNQVGAVQLHSIALLSAVKMSESFRLATYKSDSIVPRIMDDQLYAYNTQTSTDKNFLLDLIRSEQSATAGQGKLTHFTADLNKFGANISGLTDNAQDCLIAQCIEWYYWQPTNYSGKEFFTQTGSLLQYTTAQGDNLAGALNKAAIYVDWLTPLLNEADEFGGDVNYKQWNVNSSTGTSTGTARDANKTQLFVGNSGSDNFSGGDQADMLLAGGGADTLDGGSGNDTLSGGKGTDSLEGGIGNDKLFGGDEADTLLGGADADTLEGGDGDDRLDGGEGKDKLIGGGGSDKYTFSSAYGSDTVKDSDGQGSVVIDSLTMTGGKREEGKSYYEDKANNTFYYWSGTTLSIQRKGSQGNVTVEDWTNGQLGIRLLEDIPKPRPFVDPIVLDLDGDGIETVGLAAKIHFDHASDGFAELTGWVGIDDGVLARDLDGNGKITTGKELFGSETLLKNGTKASNGFLALLELDSNNDKSISGDEAATLKVWRDANQNGITDSGELLSLTDAGVRSIQTAYTNSSIDDGKGNQTHQLGSYVTVDGSTRSAVDVWLLGDPSDSISTDTSTVISADIAAMPNIEGYGKLPSLQLAMAKDATLKALVSQFTQPGATGRATLVRDILWRWTGADKQTANSRGSYIQDARWVYVVEAFTGSPFVQADGVNGGTANPGPLAAADFYAISKRLYELLYARLSTQSYLMNVQDAVAVSWNNSNSTFVTDVSNTTSILRAGIVANRVAGLAVLSDFVRSLRTFGQFTSQTQSSLLGALSDLGADVIQSIQSPVATGFGLDVTASNGQTIVGTPQSDTLLGASGNDVLSGNASNDSLIGGWGDDVLDGGLGADKLFGNEGADTYLFGRNSGQDTIDNFDQNPLGTNADQILFSTGVKSQDVALTRSGDDLILTINNTTDSLTVLNFYAFAERDFFFNGSSQIESVRFSDPTSSIQVWTAEDILGKTHVVSQGNDRLTGLATADIVDMQGGDDTVYGLGGADSITGGSGADQLYGGSAQDTLDGGTGNDFLDGGAGDDTYWFGLGDGNDVLREGTASGPSDSGGTDTLRIRSGVLPGSVKISRDRTDIVLTLPGRTENQVYITDSIRLQNVLDYDGANTFNIEHVVFDNEETWAIDDLKSRLLEGGDANDVVEGYATSDELHGNGGDDTLIGNGGADNLFGDAGKDKLYGGEGDDQLDGGQDDDTLSGGAGQNYYSLKIGSGRDVVDKSFDDSVVATDTVLVPSSVGVANVDVIREGNDILFQIKGTQDSIRFKGVMFNDGLFRGYSFQYGVAGDTPITLNTFKAALLRGGIGNDTLQGYATDDNLTGGGGSDVLYGNAGNDTLEGGLGNDSLTGGFGNNTYVYNKGDGTDDIYSLHDSAVGKVNTLEFKSGIASPEDIALGSSADGSLIIKINGNADDQITVHDFLAGGDTANSYNPVQQIKFGDGTATLNLAAILAKLYAGTAGADYLYGTRSADSLTGGAGNDTLYGGEGNDTYYFSKNNGQDVIGSDYLAQGEVNTLQFMSGIKPADVTARRVSDTDLQVLIANTNDRILVSNFFLDNTPSNNSNPLQQIKFTDEDVTWNIFQIADMTLACNDGVQQITAFNNAEFIDALGGNDTVWGQGGNDTINGGMGNDKLHGGDGSDSLSGGDGDDYLSGGATREFTFSSPQSSWGDDTLDGGAGNDTIAASSGSIKGSTFLFGRDDGYDTILSDMSDRVINTLQFKTGVSASDISYKRFGSNIQVSIKDTLDKITINRFFDTVDSFQPEVNPVQQIKFSDGSTLGEVAIKALVEVNFQQTGTATANTLTGTEFFDGLYGQDGDDTLLGLAGNDFLFGGVGSDSLNGGSNKDLLFGEQGEDILVGDWGNDGLFGGDGNDFIDGGKDNDLINGGKGNNTYAFSKGDGADIIESYQDATASKLNTIKFRSGVAAADVTFKHAASSNALVLTNGADEITVSDFFNPEASFNPIQQVIFADGGIVLSSNAIWSITTAALKTGTTGIDPLAGTTGADLTYGLAGNDVMTGLSGADFLFGGDGADNLNGGNDTDLLSGGQGDDVVIGEWGSDTLYGEDGNDLIDGGKDSDLLNGGKGNNTYAFSKGDGVDVIDSLQDASADKLSTIKFRSGVLSSDVSFKQVANNLELSNGTDKITVREFFNADASYNPIQQVAFADGAATMNTSVIRALTTAAVQSDTAATSNLTGTASSDRLNGLLGNDTLLGLAGTDILFGGDGNDSLNGGSDNDWLFGEAGDDTLVGGLGNDTLIGGNGNDRYMFAKGMESDLITETIGIAGGTDTIEFASDILTTDLQVRRDTSSMTLKLASGEQMKFDWSATGGYSIERFVFNNGTGTTTWGAADIDRLQNSAPTGTVTLTGTPTQGQTLTANNTLADTDSLGAITYQWWRDDVNTSSTGSNYTLSQADVGKRITAKAVYTDGKGMLESTNSAQTAAVTNLNDAPTGIVTVSGTAAQGQTLTASNTLADIDGLGALTYQWLRGGLSTGMSGNTYILGQADVGKSISASASYTDGGGTRESLSSAETAVVSPPLGIQSDVTYEMKSFDLELTLTGSANINGTGNSSNNVITGNVGNNNLTGGWGEDTLYGGDGLDFLDGGVGNDLLHGGLGNNTYAFGKTDGTDVIESYNDATVGKLNTLKLRSGIAPTDLTFNQVANTNDLEVGIAGTGKVTVREFFNSDTSMNPIQQVAFSDGGIVLSTDAIRALTTSTYQAGAPTNDSLTGTADNDLLSGVVGNDTLVGLAGADFLFGGDGADSLNAGSGGDLVYGGIGDDTLIGDWGRDSLFGDDGNDFLDGGRDNDVINGGKGSNTYAFSKGDGIDVIEYTRDTATDKFSVVKFRTGFSVADMGLKKVGATNNLEMTHGTDKLTINEFFNQDASYAAVQQFSFADGGLAMGSAALRALALAVNQQGASDGDTLNGSVWGDRISGLANNDRLNGLGGDDFLFGGDADDSLDGGADNDWLFGEAGNDTMVGGTGNDILIDTSTTSSDDIYIWGRAQGADTLTDAGGTDRLDVLAGVSANQMWLSKVGNDLELSVIGTSDKFTITNWYTSAANQVESVKLSDGKTLTASKVDNLVNAMAAFTPPAAGQTTLPAAHQTALNPVIAANWA